MKPETLEALKGSIKKWAEVAAGNIADKGADNCPLCDLYYANGCAGCPVAEVGFKNCENSPFTAWRIVQAGPGVMQWADTPVKKEYAKKELRFLIDLLPEEEKKNALKEHA